MTAPFRILDFGRLRVRVQVAPIVEQTLRVQLEEEALAIRQLVARARGPIEKAVVINHPSCELVPADANVRQLQAAWIKENHELLQLTCLGLGFVVENPFARGLMTAVFWLAPTPLVCTTHPSLEMAVDWGIRTIKAAGGEPPARDLLDHPSAAIERALAMS